MCTEPLEPLAAIPVPISTEPLKPELAVPVLKTITPLEPDWPEFELEIETVPLDEMVPYPLRKYRLPAVVDDDNPADNNTEPPTPLLPDPTDKYTDPPEPDELLPDPITTDPLELD